MFETLKPLAETILTDSASFLAAVSIGGMVFFGVLAVFSIAVRLRSRDIGRLGAAARKNRFLVFFAPLLNRLAFVANYTSPASHRRWMHSVLKRANLLNEWTVDLVETLKVFFALAAAVVMLLFMLSLGVTPSIVVIVFVSALAFFVPDVMFYSEAAGRIDRMRRSLPFLLDLMTVSAETGLAFQQSIRNVVANCARGWKAGDDSEKSGERELAEEFERVANDIRVGRSMQEAMSSAASRIELEEFKTFASAILQAERLGAPIVDALRQQAGELRMKLAARAEAKAAQAPVKILFPLIIFIFPVTAWVIIGPVLLTILYGNY